MSGWIKSTLDGKGMICYVSGRSPGGVALGSSVGRGKIVLALLTCILSLPSAAFGCKYTIFTSEGGGRK